MFIKTKSSQYIKKKSFIKKNLKHIEGVFSVLFISRRYSSQTFDCEQMKIAFALLLTMQIGQ